MRPEAGGGDLEQRVEVWLGENGREPQRTDVGGWDLTAKRGNNVVMVEVKSQSQIGAADVAGVAVLLDAFAIDVPHAVLVVPEGSLTSFARDQARAASDVLSVYVAQNNGAIEHLTGPDVVQALRN